LIAKVVVAMRQPLVERDWAHEGMESIASGPMLSTKTVRLDVADAFPAASVALMPMVVVPWESPVTLNDQSPPLVTVVVEEPREAVMIVLGSAVPCRRRVVEVAML